jgi:hypothetical protein
VASNRASAEFAWHTSGKASAAGLPHTLKHHFGLGYIQGYADVGDGGNGAVPLFPPQCYWSPQYRTDAGREKVSAWFQGYQAGTVAAYRDGLAGSNKLPTSWIPASKHPQVHEPTAEPLNMTPQSPPIHPEVIPRRYAGRSAVSQPRPHANGEQRGRRSCGLLRSRRRRSQFNPSYLDDPHSLVLSGTGLKIVRLKRDRSREQRRSIPKLIQLPAQSEYIGPRFYHDALQFDDGLDIAS